ncbi:hypothetical protein [Bdellovibrio sp. HCB-162]|uniref:hypothetical protein n=1 Tax=Bdellovibrio sp. HCB-162 TaxID=3394234 RepID=UPI0039BC4172
MMKMFVFILALGFSYSARAADPTVVDVRRNITLSEDDAVYKDFYINADASAGLKKNLVVTAVRKINIRDASGASAVGEIFVPVGQLKIIAVYDKVAVAREYALLSRDELPMLEQTGIMTGDRIEVKGSFIDNSKPKPKRKVAEETAPAGTATAVVVSTTVISPTPGTNPATATAAPTSTASAGNPVETAKLKVDSALKTTSPASPAAAVAASSASAGPAPTATADSLEKTQVSGNNTLHE